MDPNKEALNRAADYMEDPEVQERMQGILEGDPDDLEDAIENDDELKALRDSNPLCEELMSDPESMKVLTDPDNLRALGDAPDLIEADFLDPDGFDPAADGFDQGLEEGYDMFDGGDADVEFEDADADYDIDEDYEYDDDETPMAMVMEKTAKEKKRKKTKVGGKMPKWKNKRLKLTTTTKLPVVPRARPMRVLPKEML